MEKTFWNHFFGSRFSSLGMAAFTAKRKPVCDIVPMKAVAITMPTTGATSTRDESMTRGTALAIASS